MGIDPNYVKPSEIVLHAFDGTEYRYPTNADSGGLAAHVGITRLEDGRYAVFIADDEDTSREAVMGHYELTRLLASVDLGTRSGAREAYERIAQVFDEYADVAAVPENPAESDRAFDFDNAQLNCVPQMMDALAVVVASESHDVPRPLEDAPGTAYLAPGGAVWRHQGTRRDFVTRELVVREYSIALVNGAMTTAREPLPEGSRVIWRP